MNKRWTNGSVCERSKRRLEAATTVALLTTTTVAPLTTQMAEESYSFDNRLIASSIGEPIYSRNKSIQREDTYMKIASREMYNKSNQNPFLIANNYVNDIEIQDQYLKSK